MANFYFSAIYTSQNTPGPKFDETLKHSYKYYFDVLTKDKFRENMFASNGLGMVLAEKGEYEAAREIFTKVQSSQSFFFYSTCEIMVACR